MAFDRVKKFFQTKTTPKPDEGVVSNAAVPWLIYLSGKQPFRIYNPSLLNSTKGYELYDEMRRDEQIKAAMLLKKNAVVSTGYDIEGDDEQMKDFVEDTFNKIPGTFNQKIIEMLTALDYGFSVTEKIWGERDGMIALTDLKTRRPHYMVFGIDQPGDVKEVLQNNNQLSPVDKFIIYSYMKEFDNPYGTSDLDSAYRAWWLKDNAMHWMAMLLERMGIPPIFMSYDKQAFPDIDTMQTILENLQANTVGSIPRGKDKDSIDFWTPELASNVGSVFIPALEYCDKLLAKSILMPGLIGLGDDSTRGSLARARVHFDVFVLVLEKIRQEVEELIINEGIIRPMIDYNFANVKDYPVFKFNPYTTELKVDLYDQWTKLIQGNVVTRQPADEEHIRSAFGFPELEDGTESVAQPQRPGNPAAPQQPPDVNPGNENPQPSVAPTKGFAQATAYDHISQDFTDLEDGAMKLLSEAYSKIKERLVARVKQRGLLTVKFINSLDLNAKQGTNNGIRELMRLAYDRGHAQVQTMLPKQFAVAQRGGFTPQEAINWLNAKALTASVTSNERLLNEVKQALLESLKRGETLAQTIARLNDTFDPWTSTKFVAGEALTASYLETLVRTNTTEAYNQGRLALMRDPVIADAVTGIKYSAILDSRTTKICRFLNGKIFRPSDPAVNDLTPPNHFNCRSVWMPLLVDQQPNEEDYITEAQKGEAKGMLTGGFK